MDTSPKKHSRRDKLKFISSAFLIVLAAAFTIGETVARLVGYGAKPPILPPYDTSQKDDRLGWCIKPNYAFTGKMKDLASQAYDLSLRFDANGFKAFGDTGATAKSKVLFLGDSYTASVEVSNEKSFFNLLADSLGLEVFAYGQPGYGTLQEYLQMDAWVDSIRPEVIVWQVCSNDFIDNCAQLEIECGYKVGQRRPYLQSDGAIRYYRPLSAFQRAQEVSRLLKFLAGRTENAWYRLAKKKKLLGEHFISVKKREWGPFDQSVRTTEQIVALAKKRLPANTKLLAFSADGYQPQMEEFKRIFETNGFHFSTAPANLVARELKLVTKAADGYHWNERGHQLGANALLPKLVEVLQ